jgi:ABC-type Fe3+ transport system substrate-binding protein
MSKCLRRRFPVSRGRLSPPGRRLALAGCFSAILLGYFATPPAAQAETVFVVTSFPEELTTRYEREFERKYPDIHVQYIWKQSRDALAALGKPGQDGADVYWAPTIANFALLKQRGAFRRIAVDRAVLPGKLAREEISDPNGFYEAFDVAGYGVALDPAAAAREGLAPPRRWRDLAAPDHARRLAMPVPSKVGFSPALYDIVLQSEGWRDGWTLLSEMAGEATLLDQGAFPVAQVKEGKAVFALTIDFFAVSAKANGASVDMIYPERTAFLPAHIAMTAATNHAAAAQAFIDFALSKEGQGLMMAPDSRRHPARPDAYDHAPPELVDPFRLPDANIVDYDFEIGRRRPPLVTLLFDLAIVEGHDESAKLWRSIHEAERTAPGTQEAKQALAEARRLASFVPVSEGPARDLAFLERFADRQAVDPALIAKWRQEIADARRKAKDVLSGLGAAQ